jgi:GAF domain-containing protein
LNSGEPDNPLGSNAGSAALENYRKAVLDFSDFLLHQKAPAPERFLKPILDAALAATGAPMGNIQLFDRREGVLKIKAQRGFQQPFLDFFAIVGDGPGASCGAALCEARRVVIHDVTISPIFRGTPSLPILIEAGVQAVQSTPLLGPSGQVLGILSTHYPGPTKDTDYDFGLLDQLAREAAELILAARLA